MDDVNFGSSRWNRESILSPPYGSVQQYDPEFSCSQQCEGPEVTVALTSDHLHLIRPSSGEHMC